jgi:hypothetical protein
LEEDREERENERRYRMTAILSHPGDGGQPFSAPPPSQKMLNEDERSSPLNDDNLLAFFGVPVKVSQGSPPPCRLSHEARER